MNNWLNREIDSCSQILEAVKHSAEVYLQNIDERPTAVPPPRLEPSTLPTEGAGTLAALDVFQQRFAPLMVASTGPRYWGFVTGGTTPAALAGDWLTSLYDQNTQSASQTGDVSAVVEFEAIKLLRELFGLPESFFGGFVSGATMSNFTCLAVARQWYGEQLGVDVAEEGVFALKDLKILAAQPHSCVYKDLAMLGLGRHSLIKVNLLPDNREAMDIADLEAKLIALNGQPCIVCASGGTVNTVDFDDMQAIATLKKKYNFWWHIDAAFGGFVACSPQFAPLIQGWEQADSIAVDLHKWLNVPYDSAVALVHEKHLGLQLNTFQNANAAYLGDPKANFNFLNFLPENSRRMRALPAWMTLMAYGREGYRDIVERNVANARLLGELIEHSASFKLLAPVRLNCVCFTLKDRPQAEVSQFLSQLVANGNVYMTPTVYLGQSAIRAAMVNWRTQEADVEMAFVEMEHILDKQ
ncbi:pyridoxal phosphate-dependent decarboxylase family protein [Haliscomenobacter hydrossis]|uniref:Diaminobutyrate decarboxylase n=1 Tax=Haliscomenobacter hydrossis (strain ATCC 27775 / DSM 1100 / LMG 10767 / O) TaxID=760192 RepID=F4L294_HALH1|nr:pyridoxal-dependent decarboxylase [Haliscomenobacter hydrossis]AEE51701.1 Diaminobutyrate decarboxylase [Haliscomenobacter hydrossis DSM 1100]